MASLTVIDEQSPDASGMGTLCVAPAVVTTVYVHPQAGMASVPVCGSGLAATALGNVSRVSI